MSDNYWVAEIQQWAQGLEEIRELIGEQFARTEPRDNAIGYIQGLISDEEPKNSWTLSERSGQSTPDGMQRLLSTTHWDPDTVRDAWLGTCENTLMTRPAFWPLTRLGSSKKAPLGPGVARQYSGTAGRVENSQIGVFLTYATSAGRTFLDRELYLPKSWMDDPKRCQRAGIPEDRQIGH